METLAPSTRSAVESFVADWVSDHRIPGAAVAIVDPDGEVYAEGFGARNLERNEPATPDTLFGIGSCTKSITALAVVQLAEAGALALDDPVADYLPHLDDAPGDPITVRELLSHTSGMPSDGLAGPLITRPLGLGHVEVPLSSDDDFRRHVQGSADRRVTDRETCFYYNSGYTMLGEVVEAVTGDSYASYVREAVLDPLGMDRSTFDREAFETDDDRMTPYVEREGSSTPSEFPFDDLIHAPGGLVSSVREVGEYVRLYVNGGSLDGTTLVPDAAVEEMTTPRGAFGTTVDGREVGYGYGLMTEPFLGDTLVGHGGSIGVSNAWFGHLEDAELGVAVACTSSPETHPMAVGPAVLSILRGTDPVESVPQFRVLDALEAVTGSYETYRGIGSATVEREGGALTLTQESSMGAQTHHLLPETIEDDLLVCETVTGAGMRRPVRFETDGDGVTCFFERSRFEKA
jgi:CubicO group peptidase (beta-lactamase class C family)